MSSDSSYVYVPGGVTGRGFLPGSSGNPGGRPKGRSLVARLRAILDGDEIGGLRLEKGDVGDLVIRALVGAALKGDISAHRLIIRLVEAQNADPAAAADARAALLRKAEDAVELRRSDVEAKS